MFTVDNIDNNTCPTDCPTDAFVATLVPCDAETVIVGEETVIGMFHCNLAPTLSWAANANILTDVTSGALRVLKAITKSRPKQTPRVITRGVGLADVEVGADLPLTFEYDKRQADGTDYDFLNEMKRVANNRQLHIFTVSKSDDLRVYRTEIGMSNTGDLANEGEIEKFELVFDIKWTGVGMPKPVRMTGLYKALSAVAY